MSGYPTEPAAQPPHSRIDQSRRKRRRQLLIPQEKTERAIFLAEIEKRLVPDVEYFIFSLAAGVVITLALLLDSPAILILGLLLPPVMTPAIGLGFSASVGSASFFLRSLGALLVGMLLVFISGVLGGWFSRLFVDLPISLAQRFARFSIFDFVLLAIGVCVAVYMTIRSPKQRSLFASIPLAYALYIPVATAGYGLTSWNTGLFPQALLIAAVHLAGVILMGTLTLAILKLRPYTIFGYALAAVVISAGLYGLVASSGLGSAMRKQMEPFATPTYNAATPTFDPAASEIPTPAEITATATLAPTNTLEATHVATNTITPKPTPIWGKIYNPGNNGVIIRQTPGFSGAYLTSLYNESLVMVLPSVELVDNTYWVNIMLEDGREGWMVRSLLLTATPAAN